MHTYHKRQLKDGKYTQICITSLFATARRSNSQHFDAKHRESQTDRQTRQHRLILFPPMAYRQINFNAYAHTCAKASGRDVCEWVCHRDILESSAAIFTKIGRDVTILNRSNVGGQHRTTLPAFPPKPLLKGEVIVAGDMLYENRTILQYKKRRNYSDSFLSNII